MSPPRRAAGGARSASSARVCGGSPHARVGDSPTRPRLVLPAVFRGVAIWIVVRLKLLKEIEMGSKASRTKKVTSLALAASLLVATGPDVYGLHQCPFHGEHSGGAQAYRAHPPSSADLHAETVPQAPQQGICAWLVDCYACVESAPSLSSPVSIVGSSVPALPIFPIVGFNGPLGPRHQLFELHLPNAPPLLA